MNNSELKDLIDSILISINDDILSGNTVETKYKLPEAALNDNVIEALENNFEHYKSCTVNDGVLTIEHPDKGD